MALAPTRRPLQVVFAGTFAGRLEPRVRAHLDTPCSIVVTDEPGTLAHLPGADVLVSLAFTREMGGAARRLKLVQVPALYRALAEGTIAGAALDGPTLPSRYAFHELPNVLMTPHVSGWTEGMLEARARLIAENIRRAAAGQPPLGLVPASSPC